MMKEQDLFATLDKPAETRYTVREIVRRMADLVEELKRALDGTDDAAVAKKTAGGYDTPSPKKRCRLSVKKAAAICHVSERTIRYWDKGVHAPVWYPGRDVPVYVLKASWRQRKQEVKR